MKKIYSEPEIELVKFNLENILSTTDPVTASAESPEVDAGGEFGEDTDWG